MLNRSLFQTLRGRLLPRPDTTNHEGAPAHAMTDEHALAQLVVTGCFNGTFYATAESQLDQVLRLAGRCDPEFVAQLAVHAHEHGRMKDAPTLLLAVLSSRDSDLFDAIFERVITNGRQLRGFVQMLRSGVTGRKSLGSRPKRRVQQWIDAQDAYGILAASVGNQPSLADVVRMVHPKPANASRAALYGWVLGNEVDVDLLPPLVADLVRYRATGTGDPPNVPFAMLTSLPLGREGWTAIARNASWTQTRMNLNAFLRHGVFDDPQMVTLVADRLRNRELIARAKANPYGLMIAHRCADPKLPVEVWFAIHDALEIAIENVPALEGRVVVCPDVSGSMVWSSLTGFRKGATSAVRCVDAAALVAASVLRKNLRSQVLPFEHDVVDVRLEPRDTVLTNAERLAAIGGGGTSVSAPLEKLDRERANVDLVWIVSDDQSWVDATFGQRATATTRAWEKLKVRNPRAKLVVHDLQPYTTTQVAPRDDVLHVGGFSDAVFDVVASFARGDVQGSGWLDTIRRVDVRPKSAAAG